MIVLTVLITSKQLSTHEKKFFFQQMQKVARKVEKIHDIKVQASKLCQRRPLQFIIRKFNLIGANITLTSIVFFSACCFLHHLPRRLLHPPLETVMYAGIIYCGKKMSQV